MTYVTNFLRTLMYIIKNQKKCDQLDIFDMCYKRSIFIKNTLVVPKKYLEIIFGFHKISLDVVQK